MRVPPVTIVHMPHAAIMAAPLANILAPMLVAAQAVPVAITNHIPCNRRAPMAVPEDITAPLAPPITSLVLPVTTVHFPQQCTLLVQVDLHI